jgi:AcrR family transcriptional regulator
MASSERRARERAATRDLIVSAALRVLEEEGIAALTMRRVASDVEYTAPVVYQHFANKDALVVELVAHGYRRLVAALDAVEGDPDIDRRMLQVASAYVRFAGEHPHLFEAMNGTEVSPQERPNVIQPALDVLSGLLTRWSQTHDVEVRDRTEACEIIWGTLSGMAWIGRLDAIGNARAQRLAAEALGAILRGWQHDPAPAARLQRSVRVDARER